MGPFLLYKFLMFFYFLFQNKKAFLKIETEPNSLKGKTASRPYLVRGALRDLDIKVKERLVNL